MSNNHAIRSHDLEDSLDTMIDEKAATLEDDNSDENMDDFDPNDCVVILGKTGSGKSTLFNKLINENVSRVDDSLESVTKNIVYHKKSDLMFCDTPGFLDSNDEVAIYKKLVTFFVKLQTAKAFIWVINAQEVRADKSISDNYDLISEIINGFQITNLILYFARGIDSKKKDKWTTYFNSKIKFNKIFWDEQTVELIDYARSLVQFTPIVTKQLKQFMTNNTSTKLSDVLKQTNLGRIMTKKYNLQNNRINEFIEANRVLGVNNEGLMKQRLELDNKFILMNDTMRQTNIGLNILRVDNTKLQEQLETIRQTSIRDKEKHDQDLIQGKSDKDELVKQLVEQNVLIKRYEQDKGKSQIDDAQQRYMTTQDQVSKMISKQRTYDQRVADGGIPIVCSLCLGTTKVTNIETQIEETCGNCVGLTTRIMDRGVVHVINDAQIRHFE
jgi:predicted GTPase